MDKKVRNHLAEVFHIVSSGVTEIRDQYVVSDGFTMDDLKGITLEKMCVYIGSQETFMRAWEITLMKVKSELNPPVGEIVSENGAMKIVDVKPSVFQEATLKVEVKVEPSKFCQFCEAKGPIKHMKNCTKSNA